VHIVVFQLFIGRLRALSRIEDDRFSRGKIPSFDTFRGFLERLQDGPSAGFHLLKCALALAWTYIRNLRPRKNRRFLIVSYEKALPPWLEMTD